MLNFVSVRTIKGSSSCRVASGKTAGGNCFHQGHACWILSRTTTLQPYSHLRFRVLGNLIPRITFVDRGFYSQNVVKSNIIKHHHHLFVFVLLRHAGVFFSRVGESETFTFRLCTTEKWRALSVFATFRLATINLPKLLLPKWGVVKYSGVPLPCVLSV